MGQRGQWCSVAVHSATWYHVKRTQRDLKLGRHDINNIEFVMSPAMPPVVSASCEVRWRSVSCSVSFVLSKMWARLCIVMWKGSCGFLKEVSPNSMKGWYSTGWITQNSDWPLSRIPGLNLQRRIVYTQYYHVQPILGLTKFGMRGTHHWRHALEIYAFLGSYAACSGKFLPTFRDNRSVPSSGIKKSKKDLLLHTV